jgi:aryl-alcohol dehydrogenase (NADP+)
VVAPIVSARSPEQLKALLGSVDLTLTVDELARLDDVSAKVPADQ